MRDLTPNLLRAAKAHVSLTLTLNPDECRELAALIDTARTMRRIETRLARLCLHMGAGEAAGIPPTNPKQLTLPGV